MTRDKLIVRGAREHNLQDISIELPRDQLIVFTGLSGSGKSSLAFDTIYAEGQRRYVESLSAYARQFLGQMDKPDVDFIEGLSPAISIDQKTASRNPRSTVGTITEIHDYLRLLYARIGRPHCPECGRMVARQTPQQIVDQIAALEEGTRFQVLAPIVRGRKGEYEELFKDLSRQGFSRARVDGEIMYLGERIRLDRYYTHTIEVVVDRLIAGRGGLRRLTESLETALNLTGGIAVVDVIGGDELTFSQHLACTDCGLSFDELEPRSFSFNSPYGACQTCSGLGTKFEVDPLLVIPDDELSIAEGVIAPWSDNRNRYFHHLLRGLANELGFDVQTPFHELDDEHQQAVLYGTGELSIRVSFTNRFGRRRRYRAKYEGVIPVLRRRHEQTESENARAHYEEYMREVPCPACGGARLNPVSMAVTVNGLNIFELCRRSIRKTLEVLESLELGRRDATIAEPVIKEIRARLRFLLDVGLDYLTLYRGAATLSGGEAQRIRLATQIGSGLVGVLYVLDEPSIGLHQRDNRRLLETLLRLRDLGNTLIVVEHDEETIRTADYVVDLGPGAGEHGGHVVAEGDVAGIIAEPTSITGDYLAGRRRIPTPDSRRGGDGRTLTVVGAAENNLRHLDVTFPLGKFIAVTGVSGSGKSSLVQEILSKALHHKLYRSRAVPGRHRRIEGAEQLDKAINIDQSPIGRTPRSNAATYTKVFDRIRKLFSSTPEARARGYLPGRFSFNVRGGRCEACRGDGNIKIEMHFLPDVYVPCEVCEGRRYNRDTLEVLWKGRSIADVLNMPVEEALGFFEAQAPIARILQTIYDVGLGYIRLGQPAPTLSGGEAQRVKLASELGKRATGNTLYILDEPTTGLHFEDTRKLLQVLHRLVDGGNTVVIIEHNLDVVRSADWLIDMGPEGGDEGGRVIAVGTPEQVAQVPLSYTGKFLRDVL
ncbi:MAG: excinuclease ABC subunit UvrA [bacterium]|nr:excinuclease ABC subunit UvrA [bacterium]MDE0287748.1 excinuclease ABC subunit UvrA [bacterium]MDE0436896.1 excinuclease ABC subunit UvrA [bacterium]